MARQSPVSDKTRVLAMKLQRQVLDKLRSDLEDKKLRLKTAKARVDEAQSDLNYLAGDAEGDEIAAGTLVMNHKTGEILEYKGIEPEPEEIDEPAAANVKRPRAMDGKTKSAGEREED